MFSNERRRLFLVPPLFSVIIRKKTVNLKKDVGKNTFCKKRFSPHTVYQKIIYRTAITSTSTNAPLGKAAAATQLRAGLPVKYFA